MKLWNKNFTLIFFVNFLVSASYYMISTSLSTYLISLNFNQSSTGYIIGAFTIATLLIRPLSGYLADINSKKKMMISGILLTTLAMAGYSVSILFEWLVFCRLLHGVGWGFYTVASATLASSFIPETRISEGMATYGLGQVLTMAIVPGIAIAILSRWTYFPVIWLCMGFSVCTLLLSILCSDEKTQKNVSGLPRHFQLFEKSALLPGIILFFIGAVYSAVSSFLLLYGKEMGFSGIGLFFTMSACTLFLSRTFGGKIADKKGWHYVVVPGIIFLLICMLLLGYAQNMFWVMIAALFWGVGFGSVQPNLQALAIKGVKAEKRGGAFSTVTMGFDAGMGIGAGVAGVLAARHGYAGMYQWCVWPLFAALLVTICIGIISRK